MSLNDFFVKLRKRRASEQADAEEVYQQLVLAIADGKKVREDEILPAIGDAGRSLEQLESDVDRLLRRREWSATIAEKPAVEAAIQKFSQRRTAAEEKMRQARRDHEAELAQIDSEILKLNARMAKIQDAYRGLAQTADPEVGRQSTRVGLEIRPLQDRLGQLKQRL
ncbi:hypothetical protein [Planctomicrobium sp. SH664]|uniref:hypothetical protein n=1 Tax=Planctomicrobium sp. SH664 TaxID=3448125 RepID=UPI003F5BAC22